MLYSKLPKDIRDDQLLVETDTAEQNVAPSCGLDQLTNTKISQTQGSASNRIPSPSPDAITKMQVGKFTRSCPKEANDSSVLIKEKLKRSESQNQGKGKILKNTVTMKPLTHC